MKGQLLHLKADGTLAVLHFSKVTTLEQMQALVGGYIELVPVIVPTMDEPGSARLHLVCNEDGKNMGLPFNSLATLLLSTVNRADYIAGDAVLAPPDWDT